MDGYLTMEVNNVIGYGSQEYESRGYESQDRHLYRKIRVSRIGLEWVHGPIHFIGLYGHRPNLIYSSEDATAQGNDISSREGGASERLPVRTVWGDPAASYLKWIECLMPCQRECITSLISDLFSLSFTVYMIFTSVIGRFLEREGPDWTVFQIKL